MVIVLLAVLVVCSCVLIPQQTSRDLIVTRHKIIYVLETLKQKVRETLFVVFFMPTYFDEFSSRDWIVEVDGTIRYSLG